MTKLTEENKKSAQLLHNIQDNMERFVKKQLEEEKSDNRFHIYVI